MKILRPGILLVLSFLTLWEMVGCVAKTQKVRDSERPKPAQTATLDELIARVRRQSEAFRSYQAKVRFDIRSGSLATGELKDYREVKGFLLFRSPEHMRMIAQIPTVGMNALDMVTDGRQFRVSFAPYKKFIVGSTMDHPRSKKPLENLRPVHILEILHLEPIAPASDSHLVFLEEYSEGRDNFYLLFEVDRESSGVSQLRRKVWIDRFDLTVVRQQLYSAGGVLESDARFGDYAPWDGVTYPRRIDFFRPREDYGLTIFFDEIKFNLTLDDAKFELAQPDGYELIEVGKKQIIP